MDLRFELLTKCWTPPSNFIFPPIIQGGRKRYFNRSWLLNKAIQPHSLKRLELLLCII